MGERFRRWVVAGLESACCLTHPVVHHRPWLWLRSVPVCPLACLSDRLDRRWRTGHWKPALTTQERPK